MDQDDKRRLQERLLRGMRKHRSHEEQRRIRAEARRRRVERGSRRPEDEEPEEDLGEDESARGRSRPARRGPGAATPRAPGPPEEGDPAAAATETGEVVGLERTRAEVRLGSSVVFVPLLPGSELAVGDRLRVEPLGGELARWVELLPRRSWLARPDPARSSRRLLLAANLDLVLCVVAARAPRWKPGFVERVHVAARVGAVETLLVVNKLDLLLAEERVALEEELAVFRGIGLRAQVLSAATGAGLAELAAAVAGKTCALVGPSGVGKSSLLNALAPGTRRATAAVRASDGKGRHTTTSARLIDLAGGARLIDTPGVRAFGLFPLDRETLAACFPDLGTRALDCRFSDCAHLVEPGCAVRAAVEAGDIDPRRYASYCRIRAADAGSS